MTNTIEQTYDAALQDIRAALRRLLTIRWDSPDSTRREEAITHLEQARDALDGYEPETIKWVGPTGWEEG